MTSEKDLFGSGDEARASNAGQHQSSRRQLIKSAVASVPVVLTLAAGTVRASGRGHGLGQGHGFGQGLGQSQGQGQGHAFGLGEEDLDDVLGDGDDDDTMPYNIY